MNDARGNDTKVAESNKPSVNDKPFHESRECRSDWCGRECDTAWGLSPHYPAITSLAPRGDADEAHSTRLCAPSWCGHPNHLVSDGPYRIHDPHAARHRPVAEGNEWLTPAERLEGMIARGEVDPAKLLAMIESEKS